MATSTELQSRRHHWTRAENEELMLCYYAAEPSVHGFRKRLYDLWHKRNGNDTVYSAFNEQRLCGQVCSLLLRQYFSDLKLSRLESQAMKSAGSDNSVTAEPSIELTVHQEIDDSIDGENEIVTDSPTRQQVVLSEYQCELFDRVSFYMNCLSSSDGNRVYFPPLRGKLLSDCKNITENMNSVLTRFCISSLSELCNLCYCAARVVTEECGVSVPVSNTNKSSPPWETRLLFRLRRCKQDLSRLHELQNGRLLSQHKVDILTSRYNLNSRSVGEACEVVCQTIKALSHRLKRYRHKRSCHQQNRMFSSNQHKFYQQIGTQPVSLDSPPVDETLEFWNSLWGIPRHFNKNASWQSTIKSRGFSPMSFSQLESEDLMRALKRMPNWKSPGPDFIYGFWIKNFNSLHSVFLFYFNELLSGSSTLDPSLVAGRTVLIIKNPMKGNVPTNTIYTPGN